MTDSGALLITNKGSISPALVSLLADMVEAALQRDSKVLAGVASTQGRRAPSKESDRT